MYKLTEHQKNLNLCKAGYFAYVNWEELDYSTRKALMDKGFEEDYPIDKAAVDDLGLWDVIEDEFFDEEELEYVMMDMIKPANNYMVMRSHYTWDKNSMCMLVDDVKKTLQRNDDATIYPSEVSKGGKTLICYEYSHDVPLGAKTTIIALTDKEYEKLRHWNCDWKTVKEFAEKCEKTVR